MKSFPLAVSLGAIGGALSRYYLSLWLGKLLGTAFPYATLLVNCSGCLAMGFFFALVTERIFNLPPEVQLLIAVGFLGSFTTFSTYELDAANLLRSGQIGKAGLYWMGSAIAGLLCLQCGFLLARWGRL